METCGTLKNALNYSTLLYLGTSHETCGCIPPPPPKKKRKLVHGEQKIFHSLQLANLAISSSISGTSKKRKEVNMNSNIPFFCVLFLTVDHGLDEVAHFCHTDLELEALSLLRHKVH